MFVSALAALLRRARAEDGAVTVDWMTLVALVCGMAIGTVALVAAGATDVGCGVSEILDALLGTEDGSAGNC